MKYRPEIDGLRALSVISIVLFHSGISLFSGGFVGVDVFFVISGYLITTIIIKNLENKNFSFSSFYERRARRILPALFFMMLICIPFAWTSMTPSQMKDFFGSLFSVSLFTSNFFFYKNSGYFDSVAEERPLLHTWSLAVEEQYYLLFPIFLALIWRFGKIRVFWIIIFFATISLVLSEFGWRNFEKANFYFTPARTWELLAGSIAAFILKREGLQKNNFLSLLGLTGIVFSVFIYNENIPFPSIYTLVPVSGVMLVILYADKRTIVGSFLSTKIFVGLGLISYSVYLWHQPLFAFSRIILTETPSIITMLLLSLASIVIGYFSWRLIEKPFRDKNAISIKKFIIITLISFSLFTNIGLFGYFNSDLLEDFYISHRLNADQAIKYLQYKNESNYNMYEYQRTNNECHHWQKDFNKNLKNILSKCSDNKKKIILVFGDSHAMNLYNLLSAAMPETAIIGVSRGGCRLSDLQSQCKLEDLIEFIELYSNFFDRVIYNQIGTNIIIDGSVNNYLKKNLIILNKNLGSKFTLSGPWVEANIKFIDIINNKIIQIPESRINKYREIDSKLNQFSKNENIDYFSLYELLVADQTFLVAGSCLLYRDNNHLSKCAETLFSKKFKKELLKAFLN